MKFFATAPNHFTAQAMTVLAFLLKEVAATPIESANEPQSSKSDIALTILFPVALLTAGIAHRNRSVYTLLRCF